MGLDMYLSARITLLNRSWTSEAEQKNHAAIDALGILPQVSDNLDIIEIKREAAYWRKANQIHAWFVWNVQEGVDDCGTYYVSREQLIELRDLCQKVLDGSEIKKSRDGEIIADPALAKALLPTQEGFFFGGTEYDAWYLHDLKSTIEQLEKILAAPYPEGTSFEYQSSW